MTRRALVSTSALLLAALAPANAAAAAKAPVVKSVSPLKVAVGEKLTIKGTGFVPGKGKTRVFFVRVKGKGVASAAATRATTKKVVVTVPAVLNTALAGKSGRFKVRVLGRRFGDWTPLKKSPTISPSADAPDGGTTPDGDCDKDGQANGVDTDDDNDLLTDTEEKALGTDPCKSDTEGDGVEDGYEYKSAVDLNETVLFGSRQPIPYPGKRPYPNPLFPDADQDFDGDGLTDYDEYALWLKFGDRAVPFNYSAGLQSTVPTPLPAGAEFEQMDSTTWGPNYHDGWLDDGERDGDGDGLTNWDESHGRMRHDWWTATYNGDPLPLETPYTVTYDGTDMLDSDTDGDGIDDGHDDIDHDGLSNLFEVERPWDWETTYIGAGHQSGTNPWARVQPFNPCKPVFSKTCHTHPPFGYYGDDEDWEGMPPDMAAANFGPPGLTPGPIFKP